MGTHDMRPWPYIVRICLIIIREDSYAATAQRCSLSDTALARRLQWKHHPDLGHSFANCTYYYPNRASYSNCTAPNPCCNDYGSAALHDACATAWHGSPR